MLSEVNSVMHYKPKLPQLTLWCKFKFAPEMLSQEGARHPEADCSKNVERVKSAMHYKRNSPIPLWSEFKNCSDYRKSQA